MWYIYIVECNDSTYYTGITNNIEKRIEAHNKGKGAKYTAARKPVKLVWSTTSDNRSTASKHEAKIKQLSRREKEDLILGIE